MKKTSDCARAQYSLIAYCINHSLAAKQTKICLDVETNNQQALKLYTRLGFSIQNAYDFWTIPIEVLEQKP